MIISSNGSKVNAIVNGIVYNFKADSDLPENSKTFLSDKNNLILRDVRGNYITTNNLQEEK